MLLLIKDMRAFCQNKPMDSIVMRLLISLAVNTTAGNDGDVCIFSDKKVIIYLILHAAVRHAGRNIDFFPFCAGFYVNLQSFSICP